MSEVWSGIDPSDVPQDELASLGSLIREEREKQGLTCQAFADSLHMGKEQLEALENGDRNNLPEPVFICGMLRRVAQKLGLDPAPLVQRFQAQLDQTEGTPAKRVSRKLSGSIDASQGQQDSARTGRWIWKAAIPLLLSAVAVASAFVFRASRQQPDVTNALASQEQAVSRPTPSKDKDSAIDADVEGDDRMSAPISLFSSKPSWVSVRNRSLEVIFEGTLSEPKQFQGDQGLEVFAGRPDLVQFRYGDASPRVLGSIDQLRWYPLTPEP